jgi:hypothetical protein
MRRFVPFREVCAKNYVPGVSIRGYSDSMTDNRKSGIALIAGSVGGIVTMAIHPTAGGPMTVAQVHRLAIVSGVAHGLAMVSVLLLFLGACGLAKSIAGADRISFAAIVTFGLACIAVFVAATVSGFIIPAILKHMAQDAPVNARPWQIVVDGIFQINQAFAEIYSVAASLAVILWSVSVLRNGGLGRGLALYGCIISALIIVGISIGHLRLNVHGMAAVWFGQAIWFVLAGYQLWSARAIAAH